MGIPAFFRNIITQYSESHFAYNKMNIEVNNFYIDFNAMIYNSLGTFYKTYNNLNELTNSQIENRIIKIVLNDLLHLINDIVKPTELVYIAFDGPAPRAKMIQQRARRFKSIDEEKFILELKKKFKIPIEKRWDTTNISPGTKFMYKISNVIKKKINGNFFNKKNSKLKIILSDSQVPGEGEHKFIPEIKKQKNNNIVNCIYSPDADLIVLALSTHKKNIFIVREPKDSNIEKEKYKTTEFIYLSIDVTREAFLNKLSNNNNNINEDDKIHLINDFIFLTLLCGNDFIIPPNYMLVRNKGLDMVLLKYNNILQIEKKYLISINNKKPIINMIFFKKLILSISENELKSYQYYQRNRDKIRKGIRNSKIIETEKDKTEIEIALSRYEHEPYYSKENPFYEKYNSEFDKINYYNKNWKDEYYYYFFYLNDNDNIEEYKKLISEEYMKAIIWNLYYYFNNEPPSWRWCYQYRIAPILSDFYKYIKDYNNTNIFNIDKPLKPFEQLMLILPPQKKNILPAKYGNLMVDLKSNIIQYYPINFNLDAVIGIKRVYSEPILPEIDLDFLLEQLKKIKLGINDEKRNKIGTIYS